MNLYDLYGSKKIRELCETLRAFAFKLWKQSLSIHL